MSPQVPEGGTALYYISQGSITQWDPVAWEHTRDPKSAEKTQIRFPFRFRYGRLQGEYDQAKKTLFQTNTSKK